MKSFINKSLVAGFLICIISFSVWSLIFTQIFAKENTDDVLGAEIISPLADGWPPLQVNPSPTLSPSAPPSAAPKNTPSPKPTPTPKPTPLPVSMAQLDEWFTKYANKESIDPDLLKKIAYCESKFDPIATNGPYGGMYQFSKNTWISTRKSMNLNNDPDLRFDPQEAIKTAAFRLATEGINAWPNCNK